jgi:hypothetical protein
MTRPIPPNKTPQIKLIREKLNFKTLIDLRSEKELAMDDQKNSTVYDGPSAPRVHCVCAPPPSFPFLPGPCLAFFKDPLASITWGHLPFA